MWANEPRSGGGGAPASHPVSVLDAHAVIAYLRGEACADEVAALLREPSVLTAVNAAEVVDQLVRVFGRDPDDVHADLALLARAGMSVQPVSAELGLDAGCGRGTTTVNGER